MNFVDITNDIAFRKIFGNNNKKKSLISFLNAVINLPENKQIINVEITNPYQLGVLSGGKSTVVDVKAKDRSGNVFIVEMQVAEFDYFHKRILYYTSQSYVTQLDAGVQYQKLQPVYFIGILEFEIGQNKNYYSKHKVLDVETKEQIIQDVEFNFIELPKFNKTINQLETSIDQWTYFIKNAKNLKVIPANVKDKGLKEAYLEANKQNWTIEELEDYMKAAFKIQDDIGKMEFALRKATTAAKKEGEKEGKILGEIQGKLEGKIEGEKIKALKMAKLMKDKGYAVKIIMELTDLTLKEIKNL